MVKRTECDEKIRYFDEKCDCDETDGDCDAKTGV